MRLPAPGSPIKTSTEGLPPFRSRRWPRTSRRRGIGQASQPCSNASVRLAVGSTLIHAGRARRNAAAGPLRAAWQPFVMIRSPASTAVTDFARSNTPFQMRLLGLAASSTGTFESVRVQWTAGGPSPVRFDIHSTHLLSLYVAHGTAELLMSTEDRNTLAFA